jgi:hypothetical protein
MMMRSTGILRRWLFPTMAGVAASVQTQPTYAKDDLPLDAADVSRFGAVGNGEADDAPAINAAIDHLRSKIHNVGAFAVAPRLIFPTGVYAVDSAINLTGLRAINAVVEGAGSVIYGRCAEQPVIDALGARWLTFRDLTIIGAAKSVPRVGLQLGRSTADVADNHRLVNVKILGRYTLACLVNAAAETTGFDHLFLWNDQPDPRSFCLIQDGINHFGTNSTFLKSTWASDQDTSFNENEFINCDFRHAGGGIPIWLGDTARHRFYRCYTAGKGDAAFMIYSGSNGHTMLDIDCHCEMQGLRNVFYFSGTQPHVVVHGFSYKDHATYAQEAVFACDAKLNRVTLENARIEIGRFAAKSPKLFDQPNRWQVSGSYYSSSGKGWNGTKVISGLISIGNQVSFLESPEAKLQIPESR